MSVRRTIEDFLALPSEALPSARFVDEEDDLWDAWEQLRDYIDPTPTRFLRNIEIRLQADRDEWRKGVVVRLV